MAIEQRIINTNASLRAVSQGDQLVLRGYAARYGVKSHPLTGGFTEQIAPGAFTRSLASGQDVVCTFNHDSNFVLGRTKSGTLKVKDDPKVGLAFQCQLDNNQQAHRDLHSAVKRGDIADCSFAFTVDPADGDDFSDGTDENGQRCVVRTLRNVKLLDASIVTNPAYPNTSVDARAAATVVSAATQDAFNRARLALLATEIRQGYTGSDFSPTSGCSNTGSRYQQGQANDPTCSLRNDDDDDYSDSDFWDDDDKQKDDDWDDQRHLRCEQFHRNCARKAPSMNRCAENHTAGDMHAAAARLYPDLDSSRAARNASRSLATRKLKS